MKVQICYVQPYAQILQDLKIGAGATVRDALMLSGIQQQCPDMDLANCRIGIYGKVKSLDTLLRDRDRIEIYRPLIADPKESRRHRAHKKTAL